MSVVVPCSISIPSLQVSKPTGAASQAATNDVTEQQHQERLRQFDRDDEIAQRRKEKDPAPISTSEIKDCPVCNTMKVNECKKCNGKGTVNPVFSHEKDCSKCKGTGVVTCAECNGRGHVGVQQK